DSLRNRAGAQHVYSRVWLVERRSVREVEALGAELDTHPFDNRKVLVQREIHVVLDRSEQDIAPGIAIGVLGLDHKRREVEPAIDALARGKRAVADAIRPVGSAGIGDA